MYKKTLLTFCMLPIDMLDCTEQDINIIGKYINIGYARR
jgi:hypothetical protein